MIACQIVPHLRADGPTQMAIDEALLDWVALDPSTAVVRTYEWSVPTLSLGYFQHYADAEADPRFRAAPIVRRPTGGGALWHDREITYAVVIPAAHRLARPSTALYEAIHGAIAAWLRQLGLAAHRRVEGPPADGPPLDQPFLCFQDRDANDVVVAGAKLVGSAQRRRSGAVLQHGSLIIARSPVTNMIPGVIDLARADLRVADAIAGLGVEPISWAIGLRSELARVIGGISFVENWADWVTVRADNLRETIYTNMAWTCRR